MGINSSAFKLILEECKETIQGQGSFARKSILFPEYGRYQIKFRGI